MSNTDLQAHALVLTPFGTKSRGERRLLTKVKRRWNQVMFEAIYVRDRKIAGVFYKEPFNTLLGAGPGDAGSISVLPGPWTSEDTI